MQLSEKEASSALFKALTYNQLLLVRLLIEQGVDIDAMESVMIWAAGDGHLLLMEWLLEKGADIHAGNDAALYSAAGNGHLSVVKRL